MCPRRKRVDIIRARAKRRKEDGGRIASTAATLSLITERGREEEKEARDEWKRMLNGGEGEGKQNSRPLSGGGLFNPCLLWKN